MFGFIVMYKFLQKIRKKNISFCFGDTVAIQKHFCYTLQGNFIKKKEQIIMWYLYVFLISMVPIVELRGAIPIAVAKDLNIFISYAICIIGNMIPVIGGFFRFCLEKGKKGGDKLQAKAGNGLFVALMLFVGIPIPGTGAWTGTLAASLLDMGFKKSIFAVVLGVLIAGVIMGTGSLLVANGVSFIFAPKV